MRTRAAAEGLTPRAIRVGIEIMNTIDSNRLHAAFCSVLYDQRIAGPGQALQTAGIAGGQGRSMLVIVLALNAVVTRLTRSADERVRFRNLFALIAPFAQKA